MADTIVKPRKGVFVIMPFSKTPKRNEAELTSFFKNNIKDPIESATDLASTYSVWRSGVTFDINTTIIRDLGRADIVIADLSGLDPNPNVMYELGVRLAITHKPVILIREDNPDNHKIFDVIGFYTEPYNPLDYPKLERHIIDKLRRYETGEDIAESPVLRIVGGEAVLQQSMSSDLLPEQQRELVLRGATEAVRVLAEAYGPRGGKVAIARTNAFQLITKSGTAIINATTSTHRLEAEGMDVVAQLVRDMDSAVGMGGKTAALIGGALLAEAEEALAQGHSAPDVVRGMERAKVVALDVLNNLVTPIADAWKLGVVRTATQDESVADAVLRAAEGAGGIQFVTIQTGGAERVEAFESSGHEFSGTLASLKFINDVEHASAHFEDCFILATTEKLDSMRELLPILEKVAQLQKPLVIFCEAIGGEALATLVVNVERGSLSAAVVRIVGGASGRGTILEDIAILTGGKVISAEVGGKVESVEVADLGKAQSLSISGDVIRIDGPATQAQRLDQRVIEIRMGLQLSDSDFERARLLQRLASLTGRSATILAGGETENERTDAYYRVESGVHALLSSSGGVVPGGGVALLIASQAVDVLELSSPGEQAGSAAMARALCAPFRQLLRSAGLEEATVMEQLTQLGSRAGVDIYKGSVVADIVAAGVIDPAHMELRAVTFAHSRIRDLLETRVWTLSAQRQPSN